jgi:hypothetical protein
MRSLTKRSKPFGAAASITCFVCFLAVAGFSTHARAQNHAVVAKSTNLRSAPSKTSPRIASLDAKEAVTLLDPAPKNGFFHVRVTKTIDGWVWANGLQTRQLVRKPMAKELEPVTPGLAAARCAPDLASCSPIGCAAAGSAHALANQLKSGTATGTVPTMLTLDDFAGLQSQADNLVGEGSEIPVDSRAQLATLTVSGGQVSEGQLVSLVGYLVGVPHANTGESVNCNLKGEENNDFHIPMSNDPSNTDFQGIVVEMVPQSRPAGWSLSNLTQVESNQQLVMVTGGLFYDNLHKVNGDANNPLRGQPHRFSLWEVHNLTQFMVCTKSDNSCDPAQPGDWAPLGQ